jgi:glutaredoxin-related protein
LRHYGKEPECGFSHRVCAMLDELLADYETVDTMDEVHNHNLRNVLKVGRFKLY